MDNFLKLPFEMTTSEFIANVAKGLRGSIIELKAFSNPPILVLRVVQALCVLMGIQDPQWADCKKLLSNAGLQKRIVNFDRDNVSDATLANLRQYTRAGFNVDDISRNSAAAGNLAAWVLAIDYYCLRKELSD